MIRIRRIGPGRVVRPWPERVFKAPIHARTWIEDKRAVKRILRRLSDEGKDDKRVLNGRGAEG
jgi:hypothetical protein